MSRLALITLIAVLAVSTPVEASDTPSDLVSVAEERTLSRHPVWLKLLHYDRQQKASEVISSEFFLSPNGKFDARAELAATIEAYFSPWGADPDAHPRCRFPARYFWLSKQLALPGYQLHEPQCKRLERWALIDRVKSVSVFMISGYFGNPASTFGHSLLKLNTDTPDDRAGLFDLSVNYGALVPENEPTLTYVVRGLFGGYQAGFSDSYFYTQDLVYSRTELRDIWDYRLALPDDARILLVLHIWEIVGKKFTYYFLTENCAYRIAELIELATGESLVENSRVWYVPVQLFHRLVDIDQRRAREGAPPLVESVRFIPSDQRVLHHQFARLSSKETEVANRIILDDQSDVSVLLSPFQPERRSEILEALLAYYQYRMIAEQPNPSAQLRRAKDRVLLARLRLPAIETVRTAPSPLPPPTEYARPMLTGVGFANEQGNGEYWRLRWAAFSQEPLSHANGGDELVVMDLALGMNGDQGVFFDQLDVLRVRKLNTLETQVVGESRLSWRFLVSGRRVVNEGDTETDALMSYGAGRAWRAGRRLVMYVMADVAAHSLAPHMRVRPYVGAVADHRAWRGSFELGVENGQEPDTVRDVWTGKLQYQLSPRQAVRLEVSNETAMRASAAFLWYW